MAKTRTLADRYGEVQVNDADYGDDRARIEARTWWNGSEWDWAVPAWEERGLGELEYVFATRQEAQCALNKVAEYLPLYGFRAA